MFPQGKIDFVSCYVLGFWLSFCHINDVCYVARVIDNDVLVSGKVFPQTLSIVCMDVIIGSHYTTLLFIANDLHKV